MSEPDTFRCNCPHETRSGCSVAACPHFVIPRRVANEGTAEAYMVVLVRPDGVSQAEFADKLEEVIWRYATIGQTRVVVQLIDPSPSDLSLHGGKSDV